MAAGIVASEMLAHEGRAMLMRLARIRPFVITETMVPAASISPRALTAIERYLATGRRELRARIKAYLRWLGGDEARRASPAALQQRFTFLRLRFNVVLTQFDIFSDVLSQRSEHENGVALSGLDVVAADALALPGYYTPPPVICYLDRGHGAAIRRERTRLPGGGDNPVAVVRVPRERMIGSGIGSSLVHEVGHQAAALLDLVGSLRPALRRRHRGGEGEGGDAAAAWRYWERWISEIVADFWSVARLGVASTLGLIGVMSLPRVFVFRLNPEDPHPVPWVRVKLSCAMGRALYPHPQWDEVERLWESFYPRAGLAPAFHALLAGLETTMPEFVELVVTLRPPALRGRTLGEVMDTAARQPARLLERYHAWRAAPARMRDAAPALALAVLGQARAERRLGPEEESRTLAELLRYWALRSTLEDAARPPGRSVAAPAVPPALHPSLN